MRVRRMGVTWREGALGTLVILLSACSGPQSTLAPAGKGAERIADLFWGMTAGVLAIWIIAVAFTIHAVRSGSKDRDRRQAIVLIVGGGVVLPTIVLAAVLAHGLAALPGFLAPAPPGTLTIHVTGEQWWWRIRYQPVGSAPVDLANEIRLPVGKPVEFQLDSADVIHSFWIPSLGGKVDMIPGRRTRLLLEPTRPGTFRGVCAEYCGTSHAHMAFVVVVEEEAAFEHWLAEQAAPAVVPTTPLAARGRNVFLESGCGACHTIRGTEADGVVAPDLTHVGGRVSLAAGLLETEAHDFQRWVARPTDLKPGVHMPAFGMLSQEDQRALAAYLEGLR